MRVRTIELIGFLEFGLGTVVCFQDLPIASANVVALVSHELEAGVSLSMRWWCVDMMVGVSG